LVSDNSQVDEKAEATAHSEMERQITSDRLATLRGRKKYNKHS
jgi:hypothetical protein